MKNEQMSFGFCSGCGSYLLPESGRVIIKGGVPLIYCGECGNRQGSQNAEDIVDAFEREYNLTSENSKQDGKKI